MDGRRAVYGIGGEGPPILFLHGWGLGYASYRPALHHLTSRGRVVAPSLPGLGGTASLPLLSTSLPGYAAWLESFCRRVGLTDPAIVIGHSFGGGVATQFAHDHPDRVGYLVLVNAVGGVRRESETLMERTLADRPRWNFLFHLWRELWPLRQGLETVLAMQEEAIDNVLTNPWGVWAVGELARRADLIDELGELGRRGLPVLALTSRHDGVIPQASFDALCAAMGAEGRVVDGRHSWLLADPDAFGEILHNVLEIQHAQASWTPRGTTAELRRLLALTELPPDVSDAMVTEASALWLLSAPPATLAGDVVLCHPPLAPGEVRAVARPVDGGAIRLTVVAADRPGLLADTAAALLSDGLSVATAAANTWPAAGLAVHALTFLPDGPVDPDRWSHLGDTLSGVARGAVATPRFRPTGTTTVTVHGDETADRKIVQVSAVDQPGLLWAVCRWLADEGVSIESAHVTTAGGRAEDSFVVVGDCDPSRLAAHLSP